MLVREFINNLQGERAEGYEVVLITHDGNTFEDYLLFGSRKGTGNAFLLYSGTILTTLASQPKPMTREQVVTILGEEYYTKLVNEYDFVTRGEASVSNRLAGVWEESSFYQSNISLGVPKMQNLPLYALQRELNIPVFKQLNAQDTVHTVRNNTLFVLVPVTIHQTMGRTPKALFVPLSNNSITHIPAKGAILNEQGVQVKLHTDITLYQELDNAKRHTEIMQKNTIKFSMIVQITKGMECTDTKNLGKVLQKIQRMCKKQIIKVERKSTLQYRLVNIVLNKGNKEVSIVGIAEETTGLFLSPRYQPLILKQEKVKAYEYLDEYNINMDEFDLYTNLIDDLYNMDESKVRASMGTHQMFKNTMGELFKRLVNSYDINADNGVIKDYGTHRKNLKYGNSFSGEDDTTVYYSEEVLMKLPSEYDFKNEPYNIMPVREKFYATLQRKVKELNYKYDELTITDFNVEIIPQELRFALVVSLHWEYDKDFLQKETYVNLPLEEAMKSMKQRIKTALK